MSGPYFLKIYKHVVKTITCVSRGSTCRHQASTVCFVYAENPWSCLLHPKSCLQYCCCFLRPKWYHHVTCTKHQLLIVTFLYFALWSGCG